APGAARAGVADREIPGAQSRRRHPSRLLRGRRYPRRPRPAQGRRRPCARRRHAQDRRPRQAGAVPAPQGLLRHPGRARAGLMAVATAIAIYFLIWWIMLFAALPWGVRAQDRKSTRLNSSHLGTSYAVFCLKKKTE